MTGKREKGLVREWHVQKCLVPDDDCGPRRMVKSVYKGKMFVECWICDECTQRTDT